MKLEEGLGGFHLITNANLWCGQGIDSFSTSCNLFPELPVILATMFLTPDILVGMKPIHR